MISKPHEAYRSRVLERIQHRDQWPDFERHEFLTELKEIADDSFSQNTTAGYLGALLIYHQLLQEMIVLLILDAEFYLQLTVFPEQIIIPIKKKAMFGELMSELERTVNFGDKSEFIKHCNELNTIRIDLAHRLTKKTYIRTIEDLARRAKSIFEDGFESFEKAHWWFTLKFKNYAKDALWQRKARKLIQESA